MEQEEKEQIAVRPNHRIHRNEDDKKDKFLMLRQWLNIIFMLGALGGMGIYFFGDQTIGTMIILVAMVFKIAECSLRFIHR